jgi:hypothetical protein
MDNLFTITFAKLDEHGKVMEDRPFNIMKFKHDLSPDYFHSMTVDNYLQLVNILLCHYTEPQVLQVFNPFEAVGVATPDDISKVLTKKASMELFNNTVKEMFLNAVNQFVGEDSKFKFRVKVVYSKTGFVQLPNKFFIEPMTISKDDSSLYMTTTDEEYKIKATTPKQGDNLAAGTAAPALPGAVPPTAPNTMQAPTNPLAQPVTQQAAPASAPQQPQPAPVNVAANPMTPQEATPAAQPVQAQQPAQVAPVQPQVHPAPVATPQPTQPQAAQAHNAQPGGELPGSPFTAQQNPQQTAAQPAFNPLDGIPGVK